MRSSSAGKPGTNSTGSHGKKHFLSSWSHHSQGTANNVVVQGGVPPTPKEKMDPIDLELQRIDDDEVAGGSGVWVGQEVELRREARA